MKSSADFSVPGTGKTYIAYGLFAYLFSKNNKEQQVNRMVVFGPLNCFRAWKDESKNIFGNKHSFSIFDITEHNNYKQVLTKEKFDIYLINYEFINDEKIQIMLDTLLDSKTMVVFDEIHKLKSVNGTRANLFLKLFDNCVDKPIYKLALTGTPIPNSFLDMYNYLKFLYSDNMAGCLNFISKSRLIQADSNQYLASIITEKLQPYFVRTTKKDLHVPQAELDDIESLSVIPTPKEQELFEIVWKTYQNPLLKFIRLIQASFNPSLLLKKLDTDELTKIFSDNFGTIDIDEEEMKKIIKIQKNLIDEIGISSKTRKTIEKIEQLVSEGNKIIVWCLFIDTIDKLTTYLSNKGIICQNVTGRDSVIERDRKIDSFKYGEVQVLITNPNTLAESISLHKVCHNAIYLEFGFNLTYMLQSKDRIHRVGLTENDKTNYYYAISKKYNHHGPIDEDIYNRLQLKENRMKSVIESNDIEFIPSDSDIDDIMAIINKLD